MGVEVTTDRAPAYAQVIEELIPAACYVNRAVRDRCGKSMIATLRHRLIRIPARLIRHAGALDLRLPPRYHLLTTILARLRALPTML